MVIDCEAISVATMVLHAATLSHMRIIFSDYSQRIKLIYAMI